MFIALPLPKTQTLSRLFPLLLHQKLVRHQGDELPVGRLVVLAVDVVAEEGVEVLDLREIYGEFASLPPSLH